MKGSPFYNNVWLHYVYSNNSTNGALQGLN